MVTWTKGNASLLDIAHMIIQEMPPWGHPGLDYNNSKAFLHLCLEMSIILFLLNCISLRKMFLFNKILFNKLEAAVFLFFYCQVQNVTGHHVATNLDNKIKSCCSVDDRFIFLNLTIYEFVMIQQTISQQCGKGIICVPSNVSSFARAFGHEICHILCMCYHGTWF